MNITMQLYGQVLKKRCFSQTFLEEIFKDKKKASNAVYNLKKNNLIISIKKNLYTAISLSDKTPVATAFEIASNITESSFVSHHTAFEFYGLANQVYYDVYVSSDSKFNNFEFDDKTYKFIHNKFDFGITEIKHIKVTDLERTVIDSIKDFEKIAGLEEVLRCIELIKYLDEIKLKKYLLQYNNQFLFQKVGFILSNFSDLELSKEFFDFCKINAKDSCRYLCNKEDYKDFEFNSEWNICVPKQIYLIFDEGENLDV